jgi:hypothetical protein
MENSMNLSKKSMRLLVSLIQWADPSDGCDIICRLGEWKPEKDLRIVWHIIDNKYYPVANSFVRNMGYYQEWIKASLNNHKWEIK